MKYSDEVTKVYWEMMGVAEGEHELENIAGVIDCRKCGAVSSPPRRTLCSEACSIPDPIPLSPAELAFFMRDKCKDIGWERAISVGPEYEGMCLATPEQWIKAAVKAWPQQ